jgi:hypothetical protein
MRKLKKVLIIILIMYLLQLLIVASWHLFPISKREHLGKVYVITRGYGEIFNFIPLIGLTPLFGEPVTLTIKDKASGDKVVEEYDLEIDIYEHYPEVFTDKHPNSSTN